MVARQLFQTRCADPAFAPWHRRVRLQLGPSASPSAFRAVAVEPYWSSITHYVRQDGRSRVESALASGFESVLTNLHPAVRWTAPVLEIDHPVDRTVHLAGRGLTLAPAFFWCGTPVSLGESVDPPTLVYPVVRDSTWTAVAEARAPHCDSLIALLGRTRAKVLWAIAERPHVNTTELARSLGISPAGASQHATILRDAGLVTTFRHNGSALHRISERGAVLLDDCPDGVQPPMAERMRGA
ncbi:winged helix-turn-helix domain-containing protein [Actinokineospora sp. 24-640]